MSNEATILIYSKQEDPFNRVPKTISDGNKGKLRLSLKASMILVYLIGKPIGWKTRVTDITRRFTDGKCAVRAGLNELRREGYADLVPIRNESGFCGSIWRISDRPVFKNSERTKKFCLHYQAKERRGKENQRFTKPESLETGDSENRYDSKNQRVERELNNSKNHQAANAASDAGDEKIPSGADAPPKEIDHGKAFMSLWCLWYKTWYGASYLQKPSEAIRAGKIMEELKCRPKDLLFYVFRMWLNTSEYDFIPTQGHADLFYEIKGSRSAGFFLNNLQEIANEMEEPLDRSIPVGEKYFQKLESYIQQGRPK